MKLLKNPTVVIFLIALLLVNSIAIMFMLSEIQALKDNKTKTVKPLLKPEVNEVTLKDTAEAKKATPKSNMVPTPRKISALPPTEIGDRFDYVYNAFKAFNSETDSTTVNDFLVISHHFGLDQSNEIFRYSVGQILLESGAKQYYPANHPKAGQLVLSYAGATGFCQIMPNTALGALRKLSPEGIEEIKALGVSDFSFATNGGTISQARKWLSDKRNNMVLWGVIMRSNLNKRGDIFKALVGYNAGLGGLNNYIAKGGNVHQHSYIRGILNKLAIAGA